MQDTEFTQRALSNPYESTPDFVAALAASEERRRLVADLQGLDAQLRLPVPQALKQRLLALPDSSSGASAAPSSAAAWRRLTWHHWVATAASLLVVLALGWNLGQRPAEAALSEEILSHVHREAHWQQLTGRVNPDTLRRFVASAGDFRSHPQSAELALTVASDCWVEQALTAHLVLHDEQDALSVLLIPTTPVEREYRFEDQRFHGIVLPHPAGKLVLLAEKREPVERYRPVFAALR